MKRQLFFWLLVICGVTSAMHPDRVQVGWDSKKRDYTQRPLSDKYDAVKEGYNRRLQEVAERRRQQREARRSNMPAITGQNNPEVIQALQVARVARNNKDQLLDELSLYTGA